VSDGSALLDSGVGAEYGLILTNYFTVRDGKIVSLIVIRNLPAD
jgi:hypothetical protein